MVIRAVGLRRTLSLVKAFSTSTSSAVVFTGAYSSGFTSAKASSEHLFGHSHLSGFGRPCPPSRHILARCSSWTELRDCKHWLITLDFPKDPKPTREEMIDTYIRIKLFKSKGKAERGCCKYQRTSSCKEVKC